MERIADYRLVRSLGTGNLGEFFLATPPARLGTGADRVAVKVMSVTSEAALRRVTRELRAFAAVRSERLVRLLDAGQDGDYFFYATPYYPDGSLASPATTLSRDTTLRALADASRAAHALHEGGIAHQSIKPQNILLDQGRGVLTDLGLVQLIEPGRTVSGLGSVDAVEYVDPSILRGGRPSRASDIWSIGATLHKVVTGDGLYGDMHQKEPLEVIRTILKSLPSLSVKLTSDLADVVGRCLALQPNSRFRTALLVAERLDALGENP